MTLNELNNKIIVLRNQFDNEVRLLRNQFDNEVRLLKSLYCNYNNPYKVGDVFTDHIGSIIIESISDHFTGNPCCVYYGVELKKDGTPRKDGSKRHAYQSNEKK